MVKTIKIILCFFMLISLSCCDKVDNNKKIEELAKKMSTDFLVSSNPTLNHLVKNRKKYGIENVIYEWQVPNLKQLKVKYNKFKDYNKKINSIDRNRLNDENKLTYDVLKSYLNPCKFNLSIDEYFYLSNRPLSKYQGVIPDVITTLYMMDFYNRKDVDSFINLVDTLPSYFDKLVAFEQERQNKGFGLTRNEINDVIGTVDELSEISDDWVYNCFKNKIEKVSFLTNNEKENYLRKIEKYNKLKESFELLSKKMRKINIKSKNGMVLSDYKGGKEYYRYLVHSGTEFEKISNYKKWLDNKVSIPSLNGEILDNYIKRNALSKVKNKKKIMKSQNPVDIINVLNNRMGVKFPKLDIKKISINKIPEKLRSIFLGKEAIYVRSCVDDNSFGKVLLLNDNKYLYSTLAHEIFPGHMLQYNIFKKEKFPLIRYIINYPWYTEGYASFAQRQVVDYVDNKEKALSIEANQILTNFIILQLDYMINYEGKVNEAITIARKKFDVKESEILEIINQIKYSPGQDISYYAGGYVINDLLEKYNYKGENILKINNAFLSIGPAPLSVVEKWLDKKIRQ